MTIRTLLVVALAVFLVSPVAGFAALTEDCEKPAEEVRLESEVTSKFSKLYNNYYDNNNYGGGYNTARRYLSRALNDSAYSSDSRTVRELERAVNDARRECQGTADRFVTILNIFSRASRNIGRTSDKATVMRNGVRFLTQSNPTVMARDILCLGLSMTSSALNRYSSATEVFDVIIPEAKEFSRRDNKKEWIALMSYAMDIGNNFSHYQTKFALQSRLARSIADSRPGQGVYLKALSLICAMNLHNSSDHATVLIQGLRRYSETVPFENHRAVTRYLVDATREIYSSSSKVSMLRTVMSNLAGLDADKTPAAKVLLRAGLQVSACRAISSSDSYDVARLAVNRALTHNLPQYAARTLRDGLREASRVYSTDRKARVIRDYMNMALRS